MAEDTRVLNGINWREAFPFTQIFRAFRVAIHPSKLVLALLALLCLFLVGRTMDGIWGARNRAVPGEIGIYAGGDISALRLSNLEGITNADLRALARGTPTKAEFAEARLAKWKQIEADYANDLMIFKVETDPLKAQEDAKAGRRLHDLEKAIFEQRDKAKEEAIKQFASAKDDKEAAHRRDALIGAIYAGASAQYQRDAAIEGFGLFSSLFGYEVNQVTMVAEGVRDRNVPAVRTGIYNFIVIGPGWAITAHPWYFILYGIFFLIIWAIFGGAIARIAAVHVARDEKISVRAALKFSMQKFLSFVFAPIIPLLIVLAIGLLVMLGGLVTNIPFLGPIVVGALFCLALAAGFIMTLVMVGMIGGFNLMYPTIAVEGSDSFDAISRSFSYLYARPWRLGFYTAVAIIYGAITYLFVRFFIGLVFKLTYHFVDASVFVNAPNAQSLWQTMWPPPGGRLLPDVDFHSLGTGAKAGAWLVMFWVYLTAGILGAFAISFYFSANTIIYYLLRREVDATELDDVYVEQADEEFNEALTAATAAPAEAGGSSAQAPTPNLSMPEAPPSSPPPSSTPPDAPPPH